MAAASVVFTGTFVNGTRREISGRAASLGFMVKASVTQDAEILVMGGHGDGRNTTKHRKALELGLQVVSEENFCLAMAEMMEQPRSDAQDNSDDADYVEEDEEIKPAARVVVDLSDDDDDGGAGDSDGGAGERAGNGGGKPALSPLVALADGETREIESASSDTTYRVKRTGDHYWCACPAWRNQRAAPNLRTCKHLKSLLGDAFEAQRCGTAETVAPPAPRSNKRRARSGASETEAEADSCPDPKRAKTLYSGGVLLAKKWDEKKDLTGWLMSEKLDGMRALWDGVNFVSRLGNTFPAPAHVRAKMPADMALDGELFMGRGKFHEVVSVAKTSGHARWGEVEFHVFDAPSMELPFEERLGALEEAFASHDLIKVVAHEKARDNAHVLAELDRLTAVGAEGVMLRQPGSMYVGTRSSSLLKAKRFMDAEAEVVGHEAGKGRLSGMTGALRCKLKSGVEFSVGSGMSDAQRRAPPTVGTVITFRYQELTATGTPRFPTFVGEALDKAGPTL